MLSIDFATLRDRHRELAPIWDSLADWVSAHPAANLIAPHLIVHELDDVDLHALNEALEILIAEQGFVQMYRVMHPTLRTFLPGEWDSPLSVPDRVPDRFSQMVERDQASVVPVLKPR